MSGQPHQTNNLSRLSERLTEGARLSWGSGRVCGQALWAHTLRFQLALALQVRLIELVRVRV